MKFDSTTNHSIGDKWTFSALELNKYFDDSHLDPDGDKRTNLIEYLSGTDPIVEEPAPEDQDSDLLLDLEEVLIYNTDPTDTDSDGDGIADGTEVYTYSTDPTTLILMVTELMIILNLPDSRTKTFLIQPVKPTLLTLIVTVMGC